MENKIWIFEDLVARIEALKAEGSKVVLCHGVFDLVHIGHIRHFVGAKEYGDILVVTLTPDRFVNKGSHRPAFPEAFRAEAVAALGFVDYVAINRWPTAVEALKLLRPDIYCKGIEYREKQIDAETNMLPEIEVAREVGTRIEFTGDLVFSSSELLNRHFSPFDQKTDGWLRAFRERYTADTVVGYLDSIRAEKVLVIGDAIIDEYVFCDTIGKSTKDPVLACQYQHMEAFIGGSLAIVNHLAGFCDNVSLISCLGENERREELIVDSLMTNVKTSFITKHESPTVHKRRFVDWYSGNKLFELYVINDSTISGDDETRLLKALECVPEHDIVIVADYGHGMLTPAAIEQICKFSGFLAVNTQSNAGNRGFNPISKYPRADYVCLAGHEVAIETRRREGDMKDLLLEVSARIDCDNFTVTLGKDGSLHFDRTEGFTEVPALASQASDRVGAGDAVLALTSMLVSQGVPWEVVGFVGNVAGAHMVMELGNRKPISYLPLTKHVISLMK